MLLIGCWWLPHILAPGVKEEGEVRTNEDGVEVEVLALAGHCWAKSRALGRKSSSAIFNLLPSDGRTAMGRC